ncbi:MAG: tRNA (adenosine(37)-N6)-threonylcarbamoyltransferase complex ATPase subunit type 1 TsaE [Nitrospinae bacterium]|nr:tRNA (adenosine(37)-N6)-threonylcarbamoyltransferase complex ATPase subunit type 1 TsaE [Nitrospinota bacterium]
MGNVLKTGDIVLLEGDLGAGKTVLTQGVCRGLGLPKAVIVRSPTFTLINDYPHTPPIRHADLYRLKSDEEIETIGLFEDSGARVTIVEWAERLTYVESLEFIRVKIEDLEETQRLLTITARVEFIEIASRLFESAGIHGRLAS